MDHLRVSFPKPCSEQWEAMRPLGCNRFCAQCEKTIHNLSELTLDEAETLLKGSSDVCVRARISRNGEIDLNRNSQCGGRKMMVAAGASMGLLAAACQTAGNFPPKGVIAGKVEVFNPGSVTATATNGRVYRAKLKNDGSFTFRPLPYGSYSLKYYGLCESWDGGTIDVRASEITAPKPSEDHDDCIIIGQIKLNDHPGQAG
jgi:hypothetical protein